MWARISIRWFFRFAVCPSVSSSVKKIRQNNLKVCEGLTNQGGWQNKHEYRTKQRDAKGRDSRTLANQVHTETSEQFLFFYPNDTWFTILFLMGFQTPKLPKRIALRSLFLFLSSFFLVPLLLSLVSPTHRVNDNQFLVQVRNCHSHFSGTSSTERNRLLVIAEINIFRCVSVSVW